jgi:hypothetical protein
MPNSRLMAEFHLQSPVTRLIWQAYLIYICLFLNDNRNETFIFDWRITHAAWFL